MGYHKTNITRGELGKFSKIREEFEELQDALNQDNKVLAICELADLIGAIEAYGETFNLSLTDLIQMKDSTKSAFLDGSRTSNNINLIKSSEF